jgi:hypothetical protein
VNTGPYTVFPVLPFSDVSGVRIKSSLNHLNLNIFPSFSLLEAELFYIVYPLNSGVSADEIESIPNRVSFLRSLLTSFFGF